MYTLLEALEANSLDHKLEMQIKAALDSEAMNESNAGIINQLSIFMNKWNVNGNNTTRIIRDVAAVKTIRKISEKLNHLCKPIDNISSRSCIVFRNNDSNHLSVEIYYEPENMIYQVSTEYKPSTIFVNVEENQPTAYNVINAYELPDTVVKDIFRGNGVYM